MTSATSQVKTLVAEIGFWLLACDLLLDFKLNELWDNWAEDFYCFSYKYKQTCLYTRILAKTIRLKFN